MRPDERDPASLHELLSFARETVRLMSGRIEADLDSNPYFAGWLERQFERMGEAARRVSAETRRRYPDIPWGGIIGARNVVAHDYGEISRPRLFIIARDDVPRLVALLEPIVAALPPPE